MMADAESVSRPGQKGRLELSVERVAGMSTVVRARAGAPLKLLVPCCRGESAWSFVSSLGGGMVSGDCHELDLTVGPDATAFVGTQSSTKIYRPSSADSAACEQRLEARVDEGGWLVWAPDPVQPFAGARYRQHQRFHLHASSNVVVVDSVTAGRPERGEQWLFGEYRSRTEIWVAGRRLVLDSLQLVSEPGTLGIPERMGACQAVAVVQLAGPAVAASARQRMAEIHSETLNRSDPVRVCASPIPGGAVLRVAADRVETVRRRLASWLSFLGPTLGDDPWSRKW